MQLLLLQGIFVQRRFIFLYLVILHGRLFSVFAFCRLSSLLAGHAVDIEVFADDLSELISVDTRTQNLAHLHKDLTVLVLSAKLSISLKSKLLLDEVENFLTDSGVLLELLTCFHVLLRVHVRIAVLVVGLRGEVIATGFENVLKLGITDRLVIKIITWGFVRYWFDHFVCW